MFLAACAAVVLGILPAESSAESGEVSPELQPYRLRVSVVFGRDPALGADFRRRVLDQLGRRIDRTFGAMWQTELVENRWLLPADSSGLERLQAEDAQERWAETSWQKVFVLVVNARGSLFTCTGREWDARRRQWTARQTAETYRRGAVGEVGGDLLARLFRPVLTVEQVEAQTVELRLQAGEYPARDPQGVQLQPGHLVRPFYRYLNEEDRVRRIQTLPWTYLVIEQRERGRIIGTAVSGVRMRLLSNRRRRVESMGIRIRRQSEATRVKLFPRSQPTQPLAAHRIFVVPKTHLKEETDREPIRLISDRSGRITVPTLKDQPLVWLYVHSGNELLARVPFVPGSKPVTRLELPDDSLRLSVEGELAVLRGELIDTVAKRAVLIAQARSFAQEGAWQKVDEKMAALDELPGLEHFQSRLTSIRVPALNQAVETGNRAASLKIKKLCRQTKEALEHFLDPEKLQAVKQEIEDLRRLETAERNPD